MLSSSPRRRRTPRRSARSADRSHPPAAAPPWSCRCRAGPRTPAIPACASPACASARRRDRECDPGRRPPTARADAAGPAADAELRDRAPPRQRELASPVVALDSSAQRDVDLLAATHQRDAPDPWALARGLLDVTGLADLLVVDRQDDVA